MKIKQLILPCLIAVFIVFSGNQLKGQYPDNLFRLQADREEYLGHYEKAVNYYNQATEQEDNAETYLKRARCFLKLGLSEAAIEDFLNAEKIDFGSASFELAKLYAEKGEEKEASVFLQKHLKSPYRRPVLELNENFYNYYFYGTLIDVSDYFSKADELISEVEYDIENNNHETALLKLDEVIRKYPSNARAFQLRAFIQSPTQPEWALEDIKKAQKLQNNTERYILAAKLYVKTKKYKNALTNINKAIQDNPYAIELYIIRAEANIGLNNLEEATADIDFVLQYRPDNKELTYNAGMLYYNNADYSKALKLFNNLLEKDQSKSEYYMARGDIYLKSKKFILADNDFGMALDLDPLNGEANFKKGLSSLHLNRKDLAYHLWNKALRLNYKEASKFLLKYFPGK